jgi:hypothetical protein
MTGRTGPRSRCRGGRRFLLKPRPGLSCVGEAGAEIVSCACRPAPRPLGGRNELPVLQILPGPGLTAKRLTSCAISEMMDAYDPGRTCLHAQQIGHGAGGWNPSPSATRTGSPTFPLERASICSTRPAVSLRCPAAARHCSASARCQAAKACASGSGSTVSSPVRSATGPILAATPAESGQSCIRPALPARQHPMAPARKT